MFTLSNRRFTNAELQPTFHQRRTRGGSCCGTPIYYSTQKQSTKMIHGQKLIKQAPYRTLSQFPPSSLTVTTNGSDLNGIIFTGTYLCAQGTPDAELEVVQWPDSMLFLPYTFARKSRAQAYFNTPYSTSHVFVSQFPRQSRPTGAT